MSQNDRPTHRRRWGWPEAVASFVLLLGSGIPTIWFLRENVGRPEPFTTALPGDVLLYTGCSAALTVVLWAFVMTDADHALPRWAVSASLCGVSGLMVAWYVYFEPTWAPGADNADALLRGAQQLLRFEDPYAVTSKFGGPLSPMLGGFLLAMPFVVVFGGMYLQALVWLLGGILAIMVKAGPRAALTAAALFSFSPWSRMALPSQSDNWITAASVVATGGLGYAVLGREGRTNKAPLVLSAALYGVALAYRFILWPTVLPLTVLLVRRFGWRKALTWLVPAGLITLTLVLAPLAINASNYLEGPVAMGLQKGVRGEFPLAGPFVVAVTVAATALSAWRVRSMAGVWGSSAIGLAAMLGAVAITKYDKGAIRMVSHYDTVAFTGAVLVFGIVSLVLPTATEQAPEHTTHT